MVVSPAGLTPLSRALLFVPNETEIPAMDLHEGSAVTKLHSKGPVVCPVDARGRESHE